MRVAGLPLLIAALCASVLPTALAWWCTGHMLVAQVAYSRLSANTKQQVDQIISVFSDSFPQSPDFVQSACWADDLKSQSLVAMANWHFVNLPYVKAHFRSALVAALESENLIWAINQTRTTLASSKSTAVPQAIQLRNIIHFAGDMTQPLHVVAMYNDAQFPTGDQGGNLFKIYGANQTQLHAFWDSGAGVWANDPYRPLSPSDANFIQTTASNIASKYPPAYFGDRLASLNPDDWANDSFDVAVNSVYLIDPATTLSQSYIDQARTICEQQVAIGGYRLAAFLENIYASKHVTLPARTALRGF